MKTNLALGLVGFLSLLIGCASPTDEADTGDVAGASTFFGGDDCSDKGWLTCSGHRWVAGINSNEAVPEVCYADGRPYPPGTQLIKGTDMSHARKQDLCTRSEAPTCSAKKWETCSEGSWVPNLDAGAAKGASCKSKFDTRTFPAGSQVVWSTTVDAAEAVFSPGVCSATTAQ
jgi:hypothetical protein